jgi:hypothetical protein
MPLDPTHSSRESAPLIVVTINHFETLKVPYDYDELLAAIAPRPTLLYTPTSDRDATAADVAECTATASKVWASKGGKLTIDAPDGVTKFEQPEVDAAMKWLKSVLTMSKGSHDE